MCGTENNQDGEVHKHEIELDESQRYADTQQTNAKWDTTGDLTVLDGEAQNDNTIEL